MKSKPIIRNIIIFVVVFVIAVAGYKFFFAKKAAPAGSLKTTSGLGSTASKTTATPTKSASASNAVGADFLSLLLNIQSIKLDDSLFSNKAFTVLQDYNRPIPPDTNPGRPNPFAPIGADGMVISTQVTTSSPSSISSSTSVLNGTLTVGGASVSRWFEYGTTTALGTMTGPKSQQNPGAFAETIVGLSPNTTYYVKAAASINGATVGGNIVTWKTAQK